MAATREILATHVPKGVNPVAGGCLFPLDSARFPHLHASLVITTHVGNGNCESVINILNNHVCSGGGQWVGAQKRIKDSGCV